MLGGGGSQQSVLTQEREADKEEQAWVKRTTWTGMKEEKQVYNESETEQRDPGGRGAGILEGYIELGFSTGAA